MLIIRRYSGVSNLLIHERFSYFDRFTAILTFLVLFWTLNSMLFGLFIKPPFVGQISVVLI